MDRKERKIVVFFRMFYGLWFPWVDIATLAIVYFLLFGDRISPYRQYQLIRYGAVAPGKIYGEAGFYKYSDRIRMRDFEYTFTLPNGRIVKSSDHAFSLNKTTFKRPPYQYIDEVV